MKKLLAIVISMAMIVAMMPMGVFAGDETSEGDTTSTDKNYVAQIGEQKYETLAKAVKAAEESGEITRIVMTNSVSELDTINIGNGKKITLDLNNKNIEFKADNYFKVENGQLELTGKGNVKSSYKSEYKSTIYMVGSAEDKADYSVVTVGPEVTIENVGSYGAAIVSAPNTDKAYGAKFVIKGIIKSTYGFTVNGSIKQTTGNIPKVIVSGTGKIEGPEGAAIYAAGYAEYIVEGKLEGKYFAIEIRAGKLTIADGATLVSTGDFSDPIPNGNGSTVTGATVAVSQHTTNLPIEVVINGGTVSSTGTNGYALYEIDTVKDEAEENIAKDVNVKVNNGNFSGKIYSTNNKLKITGGTFSSDPKAYIADNHIVYAEPEKYTVEPFDADRAGIKIAPLEDRGNNILKKDLEEGYRLDYKGNAVTINVRPQFHKNGANPAVIGKWIGIAVPVPAGATKINWTVNGTSIGEDNCDGNNIDWRDDNGVNYETLYWNYATKNITSISYKFDNVGGTNTVNIAVNATPTEVKAAPLHDNAKDNPIADNALYSKYKVDYANGTATITVKGLKAHTNGIGTVGKWVGIAVPADCKEADTHLIYKYDDGNWNEAPLNGEGGEKWTAADGKDYVSFYMDAASVKNRTISYAFGTLADNGEIPTTVTGVNTVKVNVVEESEYTGGGAVVPPTTDNVTNNTTDKSTTADLTPAVSDNKSTTTVDNTTADKIVDKAVENKSTEVIVDATGNNTVASSEVALPEKTVKELAEKTDANLVIKTDNGQVDLDKAALAAVAEQAGTTGTVTLVVETVKKDENICHVDLKLVTSNGAVKDFKGGNVKVTIDLDKELAAKELVCVYIDDNGIYTLVEGVLNADGTYTFTTGHFSEYAVMAKDEADKVIADQLKTMIKDVNLKVRTSKTSKKNIKAVVSGDVKALTDAGYTVKYKFYRSTKKASKYAVLKTKADNTYINTKGKKGTKYYYKAKALVYQGDKLVGQTVLTQCKYGVRTWSK